jgi:hypothetical protein
MNVRPQWPQKTGSKPTVLNRISTDGLFFAPAPLFLAYIVQIIVFFHKIAVLSLQCYTSTARVFYPPEM